MDEDDEIIEEFAASQDEEPTVLESKEVISQRVRDLVTYVRAALPPLFAGKERVPVHKSDILMVLSELDVEFSYSFLHRSAITALIANRIAAVLMPYTYAEPEAEMLRKDPTKEEIEEMSSEDGSIHGSVEVMWDDLFPGIEGDIGHLLDLASGPVICYLNSVLWDDPSWETVGENMMIALEPILERFMGMYGFLLLTAYIRVVEEKGIPKMTYHLH